MRSSAATPAGCPRSRPWSYPTGRPIAVTGDCDRTVRVWDLTTGFELTDPLPVMDEVRTLSVTPDDSGHLRLAIGGRGLACIYLTVPLMSNE